MIKKIKELLLDCKNQKSVLVGIGNPIRGDDGIGYFLVTEMSKLNLPNLICIEAGENPENYIGQIIKLNPDNMILIDAAELGKSPGSIDLINVDDIDEAGCSTHTMSLKYLIHSIKDEIILKKIIIIGIQPENIDYKIKLSEKVNEAKDILIDIFKKYFYPESFL